MFKNHKMIDCNFHFYVCIVVLLFITASLHAQSEAFERGNKNLQSENFKQAVIDFTHAIEENPDDPEAYNARGFAYSRIARYDEAIADYSEAIRLDPKNVKAYNRRGLVRNAMKDFKGAIEDYSRVLEMRPNSAGIWYFRGLAKILSGDKSGGCSDLHKARELGLEYVEESIKKYCR